LTTIASQQKKIRRLEVKNNRPNDTTDYRTIEIFAAWKRFTPKDGVNLFQAAKIFFGVSL
jgi:hypothetical protein